MKDKEKKKLQIVAVIVIQLYKIGSALRKDWIVRTLTDISMNYAKNAYIFLKLEKF
jgi:hypothetical protein